MTAEPTERLIAAVERAVDVLAVLAQGTDDLGTNEIARRTGINASTVSRLLATLARDELVRKVPATGRYRLGVGMVRLGNAALARMDLREVVRPHLSALAAHTGETCTLSVPGGETAVTVDFVQSAASVRSVAEIGRPSVGHATATGKIVLAWADVLPAEPLPAYTPATITDRALLVREVAAVRQRGWADARGEREAELNAVAVPILGQRGDLVAVLGVQGPAGRFDDSMMRNSVDLLVARAATLSTVVR